MKEKETNTPEEAQTEALTSDQLDSVAGGTSIPISSKPLTTSADNADNPFSDIPRVPLQPIDPGLRERA